MFEFIALFANTPVKIEPKIPEIPWHPKASRGSSYFSLGFIFSTKIKLTILHKTPIMIAPKVETYAAAGVIPTKPHNAPVQIPTNDGLEWNLRSNIIHAIKEAPVETVVVKKAWIATLSIPKAEPTLKPYHPIQSILVPSNTQGKL